MISENKNLRPILCSRCNGQIDVDITLDTVECPYCGTNYSVSELLDESDEIIIEKIKSKTYKEVEQEKLRYQIEKERIQEENDSIKAFKKGGFSKVLIFFFFFMVIGVFIGIEIMNTVAIIFACASAALFALCWLMGMRIVKEPKKGVRTFVAIIAFLTFFLFCIVYPKVPDNAKKFYWDDMILYEELPEPSSNLGTISSNTDTNLNIYIYNTSRTQYKMYLKDCESMGFSVNAKKTNNDYFAFNQEGFKLSLSYKEETKELHIILDKPLKMSEIK